jgi:hypothetical protein
MTSNAESVEIVVLRDGAGSYYLLPRTALEQARVPAEHQAALEETLDEGDVSGFASLALGGLTAIGQVQALPVGGALEIISPRDAASGLATGKRQHKPLTFSISYD